MEKIIISEGRDRIRRNPEYVLESKDIDGCKCAVAVLLKSLLADLNKNELKEIVIELLHDSSIRVTAIGCCIPIYEYDTTLSSPIWKLLFTELYSTKKEKYIDDNNFEYSIVNSYEEKKFIDNCFEYTIVNFCSEYMDVNVCQGNEKYSLHFEKGVNIGGLSTEVVDTKKKLTEFTFRLDAELFENNDILTEIDFFNALIIGCSLCTDIEFTIRYPEGERVNQKVYRNGRRCG